MKSDWKRGCFPQRDVFFCECVYRGVPPHVWRRINRACRSRVGDSEKAASAIVFERFLVRFVEAHAGPDCDFILSITSITNPNFMSRACIIRLLENRLQHFASLFVCCFFCEFALALWAQIVFVSFNWKFNWRRDARENDVEAAFGFGLVCASVNHVQRVHPAEWDENWCH